MMSAVQMLCRMAQKTVLPVPPEHGVFQEVPGGRPVRGLQLQTAQGDVPQPWGELGRDRRCGCSTGDLRSDKCVEEVIQRCVDSIRTCD